MPDFLSSSVQSLRQPPEVRTAPELATAVPGFVGLTERGPLNRPVRVTSRDDYAKIFGGDKLGALTPLEVRQFFQNGGNQADIVRVLEGTPVSATRTLNTPTSSPTAGMITGTTVEPFDLEPGDTLAVAVDGGAPSIATFLATAGNVTSANTEPFALTNLDTLLVKIDGGAAQTVTFNTAEFVLIGAATAAEVAAVLNAELVGAFATVVLGAVKITSDKRGTGSAVEVTGGTGNVALAFPAGVNSGTGNVVDIDAVTVAEVKSVTEAAISGLTVSSDGGRVKITSNTTGPTSSIAVQASSSADDELGLDNATHSGTSGSPSATLIVTASSQGVWANAASVNGLQIRIDPPTSGDETGVDAEFNLVVVQGGIDKENFSNVTMDPTSPKYVETVINATTTGSALITVADQFATAPAPDNRPAVGTFDMTGGTDGSAVVDSTFTGGTDPTKGLNTLDMRDITLLCIPDRATPGVQIAMITFAEITKNREVFAILDPPAASTRDGIQTHRAALTDTEQAGLYWPRLRIPNPNPSVYGTGDFVTIACSGSVAGVMARTDANSLVGAFEEPAGREVGKIFGVVDFETDNHEVMRKSVRDVVVPKQINPITRPISGGSIYIDGTEILHPSGIFPSIGQSRGVSNLERQIKEVLDFVRHRSNTPRLRRSMERSVRGPLLELTKNGAFASDDPALAFTVDADIPGRGINNPTVQKQKKVFIKVGVATADPAKFIVILVSKDTQALDAAA